MTNFVLKGKPQPLNTGFEAIDRAGGGKIPKELFVIGGSRTGRSTMRPVQMTLDAFMDLTAVGQRALDIGDVQPMEMPTIRDLPSCNCGDHNE